MIEFHLDQHLLYRIDNPATAEWNEAAAKVWDDYNRDIPDGAGFDLGLHHLRPDLYEWMRKVSPDSVICAKWQWNGFQYYLSLNDPVAILFKLTWGGK